MKSINPAMVIEVAYKAVIETGSKSTEALTPYLRRLVRLLSLPYCFLFLINWKECRASKFKVVCDLWYILFVLKTYPYHYSLCRLWASDRDDWKYYYGSNYEPYQRARLSIAVQPH